jgi:hypothetical protein
MPVEAANPTWTDLFERFVGGPEFFDLGPGLRRDERKYVSLQRP